MADAVVGALRAILSLDNATFESSAKKSSTTATTLEKNISGLGKSVERLTPQAERMVKAFGGDRILQQANNLTAAVQKLGGVQTLTATQQANVNRQVTEAIAKYTALGQTAPAAMIALQKETAKGVTQTSLLSGAVSKLGPALIAAFSIGSVARVASGIGHFAGRMTDLNAETAIGVERLQALNFLAVGVGLTVEDLAGSVNQLSRRLAGGDDAAERAVQRLGFQVQQLLAMKPDDAFIALGEAIARVESPQERVRLAVELFGRSGSRALRLFTADLGDMVKKVEESGAVISKELIEKADRFDDAWAQAFIRWKANAITAAGLVATALAGAASQVPGTFADAKVGGGIGPTPEQQRLTQLQREIDEQLRRMRGAIAVPGAFQPGDPAAGATQAEIAAFVRRSKLLEEQIALTIEFEAAVKRLTDEIGGANATLAVKHLEAALLRLTPAQYANQAVVAEVLKRYEALREVVGGEVSPVLEALFVQLGTLTGRTQDFDLAMRALPPDLKATAVSVEADFIPAILGIEAAFDRARAARDLFNKPGIASPALIHSEGVTGEAANIARENLQSFLDEQRERIEHFWQAQLGQLSRGVIDPMADLLVGLGRKTTEYVDGVLVETGRMKNAMIDIWQSIRQSIANILSGMLQDFIGGYLRKAVAAAAGSALAGAGTGAAVGSTAASLAGSGGAGAGGAGATSFLANPAFWTNPYTIAAAAVIATITWGVTKKGWFRGGEEGVSVNPRRDKFVGQVGGGPAMAAKLTQITRMAGGGPLFSALQAADSNREFESAQSAIVRTFGGIGIKLKSFAMGGFIPPGVVQPAILHGGRFGEDIVPRSGAGAGGITQHNSITFISQVRDIASFKREWREQFIPELKMELRTNQNDLLTTLNQVKP